LAVVPLNDLLGLVSLGEIDEGEPAGAACLTVGRQHYLNGLGDLPEEGTQVGFSSAVGQVSNE
jgi:hypothetical protein